MSPDFIRLLRKHHRFPAEAYILFTEAFDWTRKELLLKKDERLSIREIALGFRNFVIRKYGFLASWLLNNLKIYKTSDLRIILEHLIEFGFFILNDYDDLCDFNRVYFFRYDFDVVPLVTSDDRKDFTIAFVRRRKLPRNQKRKTTKRQI